MAPRSVPRSERHDVPKDILDLAQRRTEFLFYHLQFGNATLQQALAWGYVQGMKDAADATKGIGQ